MKLVSFRHGTRVGFGAVEGDSVVDFSKAAPDLAAFLDTEDIAARAAAAGDGAARLPIATVELTAPVPRPGKVICVGLNYRGHAAEGGAALPEKPVIFAKWPTSVTAPGAEIALTTELEMIDYEAELVAVVGRTARDVPIERALDHVGGYSIANDVSARDVQRTEGGQWTRGKAFDDFAPIGPWLVTADEIPDPQTLDISLTLNGTTMQSANTSQMVFTVAELVSFLSRGVTLEPGDVILTGTPEGVGIFRDPPVLLKPGDETVVSITGIGSLTNRFKAA